MSMRTTNIVHDHELAARHEERFGGMGPAFLIERLLEGAGRFAGAVAGVVLRHGAGRPGIVWQAGLRITAGRLLLEIGCMMARYPQWFGGRRLEDLYAEARAEFMGPCTGDGETVPGIPAGLLELAEPETPTREVADA